MADLTTLAAVKEFLSITGNASDALITSLIKRISSQIENHLERVIADTLYTEFHDGRLNNRGQVILEQYPIISITSVFDDIDRVYGAGTEILAANRVVEVATAIIKRTDDIDFDEGIHNIRVIYRAGFAAVPGDVEQVAIDKVSRKLQGAGRENLKSERLGRHSVAFSNAITPDEAQVLERYKKRKLDIV